MAVQPQFRGPQYCETPSIIDGVFPVEPANAYSSMVIALWGLTALFMVRRQAPTAWILYALCFLLIANGVGSTLWHGLRTRWALSLDVNPALIFVPLVALMWARRVAPLWQGIVLVAALILVPILMGRFDWGIPGWGRITATAFVILFGAAWLIARTWPISRGAALTGLFAVIFAFTALGFRSADAAVCEALGFGSHPLWHIFLSTAAFLSLWTLVKLEPAGVRPQALATT